MFSVAIFVLVVIHALYKNFSIFGVWLLSLLRFIEYLLVCTIILESLSFLYNIYLFFLHDI